jgi:DNA-binding CsgD family transcriptional regulator
VELLERIGLLEAAHAAMAAARRGHGRVLAFEGPAGIGKSAFLGACAECADGLRVAWARPTELERTFAFGVARRLLAPLVGSLPPAERATLRRSPGAAALRMLDDEDAPQADAPDAVLHGLFWLLADVAAQAPLLLVIDDAHWADDGSMAWLTFAASRLRDVPVAVLLATRPVDPRDGGPLARLLAMRDDVAVLGIPPLTVSAVRTLITRELDVDTALREGDRAAAATGGNPFLLTELTRAWKASGHTDRLPVSSELRRAVAVRVSQSGEDAAALADAVAILGGAGVALSYAAALGGLTPHAARRAADRLDAAGVLTSREALSFVHPLVCEAVQDTMPPLERAAWHARAARLLADAGHAEQAVSAQLLAAQPAGDAWVVERLRGTAATAMTRGAPAVALQLLRRALAEPPPGAQWLEVLCELGEAAARANAPDAEELLRTGLAATRGERAARVALTLGRLLLGTGRGADAYAVLTEALAQVEDQDAELALLIRVELFGTVRAAPDLQAVAVPTPPPDHDHPELRGATTGERLLLAHLAYQAAAAGVHADIVRSLAGRALAGDRLLDDAGIVASLGYATTSVLWLIDDYPGALARVDAALEHARRHGSSIGYAMARAGRASALLRMGALAEAEADALDALAIAAEHELGLVVPLALYPLVWLRVDRGELDAAKVDLDAYGLADAIPPAAIYALLHHARGRLRLARGHHDAAAADFLAAGAAALRGEAPTPSLSPWRSDAALALAAGGDTARAAALVAEELTLARRAAAPRALGLALRADALLGPADRRVNRLRDSTEALRRSGCRVELARALTDLGVALLRAGSRDDARATLREALDLADRQGAYAIAHRAHTELTVAGARPRRQRVAGLEALTAAELRVARLAAEGRSNREIAAELFLSLKTVETHLGHIYAKLSIQRRGELATALAANA